MHPNVIDTILTRSNVGFVRLEKFDGSRWNQTYSLGYTKVGEGDLILATKSEKSIEEFAIPEELPLMEKEFEDMDPTNIYTESEICMFCGMKGDLVDSLKTIGHYECIGQFVKLSNELIDRNEEMVVSHSI